MTRTLLDLSNSVPSLVDATEVVGHVNARWFGATGDGSTDDTSALEDALAFAIGAQRPLFIPSGRYRITDGLTVSQTLGNPEGLNFEIRGANAADNIISSAGSGTVLLWDGDASTTMLTLLTRGCSVRNLGFEVNTGKTCRAAIDWDYGGAGGYACTRIELTGIWIYGHETERRFVDGIVFGRTGAVSNLEAARIANSSITGCSNACFNVKSTSGQSKYHVLDRCNFAFSDYGIYLESGSFSSRGCVFSHLALAVFLGAATDTIRLSDTDSESCSRFLYTTGSSAAVWLVAIDNLRGSLGALHSDGRYIYFTHRGGLSLRQCLFEPTSAAERSRFRVITRGFVQTQGCLFPNRTPMEWFAGEPEGWTSVGDYGTWIDSSGNLADNPEGNASDHWWPLPARIAGVVIP